MSAARRLALIAFAAVAVALSACDKKKGKVDSGGGSQPPAPAPTTPGGEPTGSTYSVYNDAGGALVDPEALLFNGGGITIEERTDGATEGVKYLRAVDAGPGTFWGVSVDRDDKGIKVDLSEFSGGDLRLSVRIHRALASNDVLNVDLTDHTGKVESVRLDAAVGFDTNNLDWQTVVIPVSKWDRLDLSNMWCPFGIGLTGSPPGRPDVTFDVDDVRWTK